MNNYINGETIKKLREREGITQAELAEILSISPKTVSKWETSKGLPDITLLMPLASALKVSLIELVAGYEINNNNIGEISTVVNGTSVLYVVMLYMQWAKQL